MASFNVPWDASQVGGAKGSPTFLASGERCLIVRIDQLPDRRIKRIFRVLYAQHKGSMRMKD
jgi:hypothetical protein